MLAEPSNRFQVCVKVRPSLSSELHNKLIFDQDKEECVKISQSSHEVLLRQRGNEDRKFTFDSVLGHKVNQVTTYKHVGEDIVNEVLQGYNGTIMAYGQTGSGKTYTIFGSKKSMEGSSRANENTSHENGIVFQSLSHIFRFIEEHSKNRQFRLSISFYEIYLENIIDLLGSGNTRESLQIREDPVNGMYIAGLAQHPIRSYSEVVNYIRSGIKNRITQQTMMNKTSSRSHAILQLTLEQRWIEEVIEPNRSSPRRERSSSPISGSPVKKKHVMKGILSLVDLAGSERLSKSSGEKLRTEEAKTINKAISTLGICIAALANDRKMATHIPFRDSKLTRVLSDCLGGGTKMSICACVSPITLNYDETYSTLLFASRAMMVKVTPQLNKNTFVKAKEDPTKQPTIQESNMQYNELFLETQRLREQVQLLQSQLPQVIADSPTNLLTLRGKASLTGSETKQRSSTPNAWPTSSKERSRAEFSPSFRHNETMESQRERDKEYDRLPIYPLEPSPRKSIKTFTSKMESFSYNNKDKDKDKEQELIRRYTDVIEHLQSKLSKKSTKMAVVKEKLEKYKRLFGDIQ